MENIKSNFLQKLWFATTSKKQSVIAWGRGGETILIKFKKFEEFLTSENSPFDSKTRSNFIMKLEAHGFIKIRKVEKRTAPNEFILEYSHPKFNRKNLDGLRLYDPFDDLDSKKMDPCKRPLRISPTLLLREKLRLTMQLQSTDDKNVEVLNIQSNLFRGDDKLWITTRGNDEDFKKFYGDISPATVDMEQEILNEEIERKRKKIESKRFTDPRPEPPIFSDYTFNGPVEILRVQENMVPSTATTDNFIDGDAYQPMDCAVRAKQVFNLKEEEIEPFEVCRNEQALDFNPISVLIDEAFSQQLSTEFIDPPNEFNIDFDEFIRSTQPDLSDEIVNDTELEYDDFLVQFRESIDLLNN